MAVKKETKKTKEKEYTLIEKMDYSAENLAETDFELIEFRECIFANLSEVHFTDCLFTGCNLSNLPVLNTKMQDVFFNDCKIVGVNFFDTNDFCFSVHFNNCILDYAGFERKKVYKSSFKNCRMHGANFTGADLSESSIENCDFSFAIFASTNLNGVDFTTNYNFDINPNENYLKKAKFNISNLSGLLRQFGIIIEGES